MTDVQRAHDRVVRESGPLSLAQILEIAGRGPASAAVHRLRRQRDRARGRPRGSTCATPARHHLPGHRAGRPRAGPRLRGRRPRDRTACTRATRTSCSGARRRRCTSRGRRAAACSPTSSARIGVEHLRALAAAAAGGAAPVAAGRRGPAALPKTPRRRGDQPPLRRLQHASTSGCSARR